MSKLTVLYDDNIMKKYLTVEDYNNKVNELNIGNCFNVF